MPSFPFRWWGQRFIHRAPVIRKAADGMNLVVDLFDGSSGRIPLDDVNGRFLFCAGSWTFHCLRPD